VKQWTECGVSIKDRIGVLKYSDKHASVNFREGFTKCSNEVYNKITKIRQHNKYLLEYIGYLNSTFDSLY